MLGLLHVKFITEMAFAYCQNFVSSQYLPNERMEFDLLHIHVP